MGRPALLALLAAALWAGDAAAGEAEKFVITILKVELKTADSTWITVIEPDKQVDLVNEEPTVSFFNNKGRVPAGKYVNFRMTLSETVSFAGFAKRRVTLEGGKSRLVGTAPKASELPGEFTAFEEESPTQADSGPKPGTVTQKLDLDLGDADDVMTLYGKRDFPSPVEIRRGSFVKFWFDMDLSDIIHHAWPGAFDEGVPARDVLYVLPPKQISQFVIVVDEREEALNPEAIVLEF